jgi:bacterioferritin (cytochrome b1)
VEQQRVARLEYQLTRKTLDVSLNDYNFWDAMATAFKYCQENTQLFQKQVLDALFDTQKEGHISWSKDKKDVLVSRISKAINDN